MKLKPGHETTRLMDPLAMGKITVHLRRHAVFWGVPLCEPKNSEGFYFHSRFRADTYKAAQYR